MSIEGVRTYTIRSETGVTTTGEDGKVHKERKNVVCVVDWTGITEKQVEELAEAQLLVRFQNRMRGSRILDDEEHFLAKDHVLGAKGPKPLRPEDMTIEQLTALIEAKQRKAAGFDA